MKRSTARFLHETTNATYWMENPDWRADTVVENAALAAFRLLPFSVHALQKKILFKDPASITVSGESVVHTKQDHVNKYMFRYPGDMSIEKFKSIAEFEVAEVNRYLAGIALDTEISTSRADIFRRPIGSIESVTQTQPRISLLRNPPLYLEDLEPRSKSISLDQTAKDLEKLVQGTLTMSREAEYYPDIAFSSHNLRRNISDGSVTLIDVMPIKVDGTRLIGDSPSKLPHTLDTLDDISDFIGQYGN